MIKGGLFKEGPRVLTFGQTFCFLFLFEGFGGIFEQASF